MNLKWLTKGPHYLPVSATLFTNGKVRICSGCLIELQIPRWSTGRRGSYEISRWVGNNQPIHGQRRNQRPIQTTRRFSILSEQKARACAFGYRLSVLYDPLRAPDTYSCELPSFWRMNEPLSRDQIKKQAKKRNERIEKKRIDVIFPFQLYVFSSFISFRFLKWEFWKTIL